MNTIPTAPLGRSMRGSAKWLWVGCFLVVLLSATTFITLRYGIERGRLETVEYDFPKALSGKQRMVVYLPPNYPHDAPYPALYLLHGGGDDENSWQTQGMAASTLDHLYAEKQIGAMIVVMPNAQGRGNAFEQDLLESVIPYIESHYATQCDNQHRAIAGTSLGGWQALCIGLKHTDHFAWIGSFSPAIMNDELPAIDTSSLKLLWLSCGDQDPLTNLCKALHQTLEQKNIAHLWHVSPGVHEWPVWKNDLSRFVPLLFSHEPSHRRPTAE
jgi:enterochelin esterase-like enzyme